MTRRTRIAARAAFATVLVGLFALAIVTQLHRNADTRLAAVRVPELPSYADRFCYQRGAAEMRRDVVIHSVERELTYKYGGDVAYDYARVPSTTTRYDIEQYYRSRIPDDFHLDRELWLGVEYWNYVRFREGFSSRRVIAAVLVDYPYPDSVYVDRPMKQPDFKWLIVFDMNRKDQLAAQHSNGGCITCDSEVEDSTSKGCIAYFCTRHPDNKHWCSAK
jgi:hypothetical protein